MNPLIHLSNVRKRFGLTIALRDVTLTVNAGQACVLIGDNGAGKSTILSVVSGVLRPDSGRVTVLGAQPSVRREFSRITQRVGILLHQALLYPQLSVEQNLKLFAALYGVSARERVPEVLELLGVESIAERRVAELSQGMLKRVALARAVLHQPELLLLDEPFAHLDVEWKERVAQIIKERVALGGAALFSSHEPELIRLTGAESILLSAGRIVAEADKFDAVRYVQ